MNPKDISIPKYAHDLKSFHSWGSFTDVLATAYGEMSAEHCVEVLDKVACAGSTWLLCLGICRIHKKFSEHVLRTFSTYISVKGSSRCEGM